MINSAIFDAKILVISRQWDGETGRNRVRWILKSFQEKQRNAEWCDEINEKARGWVGSELLFWQPFHFTRNLPRTIRARERGLCMIAFARGITEKGHALAERKEIVDRITSDKSLPSNIH